MGRLRRTKRGVSLLELIAVVTLLGIIASVSVASYRRGTLGNVSAKVEATRVNQDLRLARQRAIATGDNHFLSFGGGTGNYSYQIVQRKQDGTTVVVQAPYVFHRDVTVTVSPSNPEFSFEGDGLAAYTIVVRGADKVYRITVNQITGTSRITES